MTINQEMVRYRWPCKQQKHAFTLLELLVAMSVLALLLVLLLSMVNGATKLWRANENRVDSYREARAAINLISDDLASIYVAPNSAYVTNPNSTFFYTQEDKELGLPVTIDGMKGGLLFLAAIPTGAQASGEKSDLCTVGYYLGYATTSLAGNTGTAGIPSYNLYRYFRGSNDTWAELKKTGNILQADILLGVPNPGETSPLSTKSEMLAKNITGFTVSAYTVTSDPATKKSTSEKFKRDPKTPLPDVVEIEIKAISNEAAKRFANSKSDWENTTSLTRTQDERTFKTRIFLHGADQLKKESLEAQFPTPTPLPTP